MPRKVKNFHLQFQKIRTRVQAQIDSNPTLKKIANRVRLSKSFKTVADTVETGLNQLRERFREFPNEMKQVRPFLQTKRETLMAWRRNPKSKVTAHQASAKSKTKSKRSRSTLHAGT